jgi:hypothetical protein
MLPPFDAGDHRLAQCFVGFKQRIEGAHRAFLLRAAAPVIERERGVGRGDRAGDPSATRAGGGHSSRIRGSRIGAGGGTAGERFAIEEAASRVDGVEQAGREAAIRISEAAIAKDLAREHRLNNGLSFRVDGLELAGDVGRDLGEPIVEPRVDLPHDGRGDLGRSRRSRSACSLARCSPRCSRNNTARTSAIAIARNSHTFGGILPAAFFTPAKPKKRSARPAMPPTPSKLAIRAIIRSLR